MGKTTHKSKQLYRPPLKTQQLYKITPWIIAFVVYVIIVRIVSPSFYLKPIHFEPGELVIRNIEMPFDVDVIDREATDKLINEVETKFIRYYDYDSDVAPRVQKKITQIFSTAKEIIGNESISEDDKTKVFKKELIEKFGVNISEDEGQIFLDNCLNTEFKNIFLTTMNDLFVERGIISGKDFFMTFEKMNVLTVKPKKINPPIKFTSSILIDRETELRDFLEKSLWQIVKIEGDKNKIIQLISRIFINIMEPNVALNIEESSLDKKKKIGEIKPVFKHFNKGAILISKGERITPLHSHAILTINNKILYFKAIMLIGISIFVLIIFIMVAFYIHKFRPDLKFTTANVTLVSLPILLSLFVGRVLTLYFGETNPEIAGFLFPAGVIGMLGVILLDARLAFLLVIWGTLLFGISFNFSYAFRYVLYGMIGGFVAIGALYTIKERKDIIMAGLKLALVNAVAILVIDFVEDPSKLHINYAAWGIVNGLVCICISIPALPFFENFFNIVTDIRLLELTGIHQPLLTMFEEKSPGSYQHSLNVAKLADAASVAIGARYLLARAGAYYHDVGKMFKSKYFSENQVTPDDKKLHSKLSPHMSTLIVKNHIKEGLEFARKFKLPQIIADFIPQHHGTSIIKYFYYEARQNFENSDSTDPVREEDFRYPGPKPQSVEAAIVMLADAVEATATAKLSKPVINEDDLRLVVRDTISEKFDDEQLDECHLTLHDLHTISESFVNTLRSRYHHRIDYPQFEQKLTKERE